MSQPLTYYEERREGMVQELKDLCAALNKAGATPPWTPSRLHSYINARYDVEDGLDSLGGKELDEINSFLSIELEVLQGSIVPTGA